MADTVNALTSAVNSTLAKLTPGDEIAEADRYQLLDAIDKLRVAVEPPLLTVRNLCFGVSHRHYLLQTCSQTDACHDLKHHGLVAIRVAMGMGIFDAFASAKNGEMNADALDENTKGDKALLGKFLPSFSFLFPFFSFFCFHFHCLFSSLSLFLSAGFTLLKASARYLPISSHLFLILPGSLCSSLIPQLPCPLKRYYGSEVLSVCLWPQLFLFDFYINCFLLSVNIRP